MTKKLKSLNPIIGTGYKTLSTIKDGEDGNIENFPDTLPKIPRLSYKRLGVSGLEIGWEFEDKIYYTYELYGSTTKGFKASEENLIFQGLASSYFYEAKPGEKWYFKARAKNTHGRYTEFSSELVTYTIKLDNLGDYVEGGSINGALIENATINNAHIKDLHADKITAGVLDADRIGANSITANKIEANAITSEKIQANAITTDKLAANIIASNHIQSGTITSGHIQSGTIESGHIKAGTIESDHIKSNSINSNHIQANTIQSEHIQTGAITAGSSIIANGAIGSAQISSLDANKIDAGEINTAKVKIKGENGFLFIENNTLYVVDNKRKIRCELGVIENNSNYGFVVRGADGQTIMLDHRGVHNAGITDGAIDNRKVSENANISGKKLDIDSVVKSINEDGSVTLKGTKIQIGNTTLDVKLSEQNNLITEHGQKLATQQSEITANTEAIKLKVDNQTYTEDKKNMTSSLSKATSDISVLQGQIALKVEQSDIETANNTLKSEIQEDLNDINDRIDGILDDVGGAIADGIIDESETIMINSSITQLNKEKETLTQRYNYIYGLSTLASGMKSSLKTMMNTYNTKQIDLISHIQSMITDKHISDSERTTYNTRLTEYPNALANVNKKIEECMDSI
ncbi:MAG: hypothetical protein J6D12_00855, partial [Peptostreptococcaceae bacterium]|nr:hypothetical protein [Peptostreptococcaceae bacterium]